MPRRLTLRPRNLDPLDPTLGPGPTTSGNSALGGRTRPGAGADGAGGNDTSSRFGDRFPGRPDRSGPGPGPPGGGSPPRTGRPPTPPRQTPQDFPEIWWSGDRAPLAIIYGRARVRCFPVTMAQDGDKLVFLYIIGLGPISEIEDVYINSQEFDGAAEEFDGWTINEYLGTDSQTADPLLSAAITGSPGYTDALDGSDSTTGLGSAYLAISAPVGSVSGVPFVEVIAQGREITDPRTSPATVAYSTNPALILADIIRSDVYGWGRSVDDTSLGEAADACDETVGGEKRRELGLVLYEPREALSVVQEIAEYAAVIMDREGDTIRLVPDRPRAVDHHLNDKDHIISSRYTRKRATDVPEVVEVAWYDVDAGREKEIRQPNDDAATAIIRARLTGIPSYAQAKREAIERYNRERLEDLSGEIVIAGRGLGIQVGDVVAITDRTIAITDKPFRVLSVRIQQPGVFRLGLSEYQAGVYSDDVTAEPDSEDTGLPGVFAAPPRPGSIESNNGIQTVTAELEGDTKQQTVTVAAGLEAPDFPVDFVGIGYRYNIPSRRYQVEAYDPSSSPARFVSRTIMEGVLYYGTLTSSGNVPVWLIDGVPVDDFVAHELRIREIGRDGRLSAERVVQCDILSDNRPQSKYFRVFDDDMSIAVSGGDLIVDWGSGVPFGGENFSLDLVRVSPSFNDFGTVIEDMALSATNVNLGTSYFSGTGSHEFFAALYLVDRYSRRVVIGQVLETVTV